MLYKKDFSKLRGLFFYTMSHPEMAIQKNHCEKLIQIIRILKYITMNTRFNLY